jgi:hypothetical protein
MLWRNVHCPAGWSGAKWRIDALPRECWGRRQRIKCKKSFRRSRIMPLRRDARSLGLEWPSAAGLWNGKFTSLQLNSPATSLLASDLSRGLPTGLSAFEFSPECWSLFIYIFSACAAGVTYLIVKLFLSAWCVVLCLSVADTGLDPAVSQLISQRPKAKLILFLLLLLLLPLLLHTHTHKRHEGRAEIQIMLKAFWTSESMTWRSYVAATISSQLIPAPFRCSGRPACSVSFC